MFKERSMVVDIIHKVPKVTSLFMQTLMDLFWLKQALARYAFLDRALVCRLRSR